jgi:hypothetical protein
MNLPRMLHEIIAGVLATQDDMQVVGDFDRVMRLQTVVDSCLPDIIITGSDGIEPADVYRVLVEHPELRVLTVSTDGRRAFLSEVRPNHVALGEASPQKILTAIRAPATVSVAAGERP